MNLSTMTRNHEKQKPKLFYRHLFLSLQHSVMEVMKQLDQGEIAATARARLHGDMMPQRNDVQLSRPQAPRPMTPAMNPAFTYQGTGNVRTFPSFRVLR